MKRFNRRQFGVGAWAAAAIAGVGLPRFAEAKPLAQERGLHAAPPHLGDGGRAAEHRYSLVNGE